MSLASKYGISEQTVKAMIKDGWITCNASQYEEVHYFYQQQRNKGVTHSEAIKNASITYNISDRWVYEIIKKFE